jgi:HD-like signal output (HDOD) protein
VSATSPAPGAPTVAPHAAHDPEPAASGAAPAAVVATPDSVMRSMQWRVRVLLADLPHETLRSDGPAFARMLLEGGEAFISHLPAAAQRALATSRRPEASLDEIVTLFEDDPMLTQGLLRMANSAFYRRGDEPVVAIRDAAGRVGLRGVQAVLTASIVEGLLCRPGGEYDAMVRQTWEHMQRTAPLARALAPAFRADPETAYALALLHDVGKLVIFDLLSGHRRRLRRDLRLPRPFMSALLAHLHEPVGALAMLRWGLGGEAAHAVGGHHRRPVPALADPVTEVLFVAEAVDIARARGREADLGAVWAAGSITADPERAAALLPGPDAEAAAA